MKKNRTWPNILKSWREEKLLTVQAAAEIIGVSVPALKFWEAGTGEPSIRSRAKLRKAGVIA